MNFRPFADAVSKQFDLMSKHELFRLDTTGDKIWELYLGGFPEGTNPIFRTKTEHDGSYDRHFVRDVGNVVAILPDGSTTSIWDAPGLEHPYNMVCAKVRNYLRDAPIVGLFRTKETVIGHAPNTVQRADGTTERFTHFRVSVAAKHQLFGLTSVDSVLGEARTRAGLFLRGLNEITPEALSTVLELIEQKTLYRGEEFEAGVRAFQKLQNERAFCTPREKSLFVWRNLDSPAARLRNTVIGTLLTDLSEGMETERALRAFEQKVAPTNYKRPTAAITPRMIADATKTIEELGLEQALERRFAKISDISVNNVLWVDSTVRSKMKGGLTDLLMKEVKVNAQDVNKNAIEISIDDFMQRVLPEAITLEAFFANSLQANLMSLTASVHADAPRLFKWDNNFAWSYNGNITDSIKEKVKAAGGNINAPLRVSLAWFNGDDLDIHANCPLYEHIYFGAKQGVLDIDMNAGGAYTRTPVENLSWRSPPDGRYAIWVYQYYRRETIDVGFTVELENNGKVVQYSYPKAVTGEVPVLMFDMENGVVHNLAVAPGITIQGIQQQKWGVNTEQFVKVSTVLNSPNHWDGNKTGNKHWFFILDGCANDEPARGMYNEFLKPELEAHRKVFEVLGNKLKCPVVPDQLSGLGFSSTKRESVLFKVSTSSFTKMYAVQF